MMTDIRGLSPHAHTNCFTCHGPIGVFHIELAGRLDTYAICHHCYHDAPQRWDTDEEERAWADGHSSASFWCQECGSAMPRDEALAWYRRVPEGTAPARHAYREQFGAGRIAEMVWNDSSFTLGVEYGIRIALAKAFELTPEDLSESELESAALYDRLLLQLTGADMPDTRSIP